MLVLTSTLSVYNHNFFLNLDNKMHGKRHFDECINECILIKMIFYYILHMLYIN